MTLSKNEREELEALRADKVLRDLTAADHLNPDVFLLEGCIDNGISGEYSATGVRTSNGTGVYLAEAIKEWSGWTGEIATFQWHVSSEPLGFHALQEELVKESMGSVRANFSHAYSDLTGYLWTNEIVEVGGHNVLKEILETARSITGRKYLAIRIERKK